MKLLLIGFNTRPLAESAARAGYTFISADFFGDLDHALLCPVYSPRRPLPGFPAGDGIDMKRLTEWGIILARQGAWDHLVYSSGYENRPDLLRALLSEGGRLLGNSLHSLEGVRDPAVLARVLCSAGYHVPRACNSEGNAAEYGRRWIIKPLKSGGGHGVRLKKPGEAVPEGSICQEYISGRQCSFTFVADGSRSLVLGITEQLAGTGVSNKRDFGYGGNIFPLDVEDSDGILEAAEGIARRLTTAFALKGLNGVDFVFDGKNCWVIEVNPRYSASMELLDLAYGVSLFQLHLLAAEGEWHKVENIAEQMPIKQICKGRAAFWGKKVIYTGSAVMVKTLQAGRFAKEREWARRMHELGLRDLPFPGEIISAGGPVATAVARGESRAVCLQELERTADLMRGQLCPLGPGIMKPEGERHENDTDYRADA